METMKAIADRRSIRKFTEQQISRGDIERILSAAIQAPSSKNSQPWKFVVVGGAEKAAMLDAFASGLASERAGTGLFPGSPAIPWAEQSLRIMEQAPVTVFVLNTSSGVPGDISGGQAPNMSFVDMASLQSVSAAIENMLLCATDMGIGSLWICDIFFAYREICRWLDEPYQPVAAVSFGYPAESPKARPRKLLAEVVSWRGDWAD